MFASRLCFRWITLVTLEPCDKLRFPVWYRVGIACKGTRHRCGGAMRLLLRRTRCAGKAGVLLLRLVLLRLFDRLRWRHHRDRFGLGIRLQLDFFDWLLRYKLRLRFVLLRAWRRFIRCYVWRNRRRSQLDPDHRWIGDQLSLISPPC